MKILIATDAFHPQISGVVTTVVALEKALVAKGHQVEFIEPNMFFHIPTPGYKEIPISFPLNIEEKILTYQPDAVHIHTEGTIGLITSKICNKLRIPYTSGYATHFAELVHKKYFIPERLTWKYLRWLHNRAVRTLVATNALVTELNEHGVRNVVAWGKGVDSDTFNSKHKNTLSIPFERPIWLYVGRISVEKNLRVFLDLDLPGTKVCIGRGPEFDKYRKHYKNAQFLGCKTGKELAQWYANSDVMVFPSIWDTFGLVMIEAAACGTPVAAYPVRGPLQAIKHNISGYMDADLRVACLEALKLDRKVVEEFTHTTFSWETAAEEFVHNLEKICWIEKINWSNFK